MGLVRKQASWNLLINYLGVFIGFINLVVLFPRFLSPEEFGLTRTLLAIAAIYMQFSTFGISRGALRVFSIFDEKGKSNGFLLLITVIPVAGFLVFTIFFLILRGPIIEFYKDEAVLLVDNLYYCLPMTFFMILAFVYELYLQTIKQTVLSTFFRIIVLRLIWLVAVILLHFKIISFSLFLIIFSQSYLINFLVLVFELWRKKELDYSFNKVYFKWRLIKQILKFCFFSFFSGLTIMLVNKVDILMIGGLLGLKEVGAYSIAMYFCSISLIPQESLFKILNPFISSEMKGGNHKKVGEYYKQSVSSTLLIGGFILVLILINYNELFSFLPLELHTSLLLVFVLSLSKFIYLILGCNSMIMSMSNYYKFDAIFAIFLLIISVVNNLIFISIYGLLGAAIATTVTMLIYTLCRVIFIFIKLKVSPISNELFKGIFLLGGLYLIGYFIPNVGNELIDLGIKSLILILLFVFTNWYFEINQMIRKLMQDTFSHVMNLIK